MCCVVVCLAGCVCCSVVDGWCLFVVLFGVVAMVVCVVVLCLCLLGGVVLLCCWCY